ncbi:MAG: glycosyltransferase family 2 protein [Vicinamibacteria bacterium]|nr:glycosyltransferase family 2 protein [Vicinamibacteria bacterium]
MPAFNEQDNIEKAVNDAYRAVSSLVGAFEIIVVDDGSHDETPSRLAALLAERGEQLRVVRHDEKRGYGVALRDGFSVAKGALVFYTDADNQFDLGELADCMPMMREWDVVLGYRIDRQDPWLRKLTSSFFNRMTSLAFGLPAVRDLNCSFKLMRRDVLARIDLQSSGFLFDTELIVRLQQSGARCIEHGVRHYPRRAGRSTVRPGDVPRTIAALLRMRRRLGSARRGR